MKFPICILYIYGKTNVPNHQPDYEEMEATTEK